MTVEGASVGSGHLLHHRPGLRKSAWLALKAASLATEAQRRTWDPARKPSLCFAWGLCHRAGLPSPLGVEAEPGRENLYELLLLFLSEFYSWTFSASAMSVLDHL